MTPLAGRCALAILALGLTSRAAPAAVADGPELLDDFGPVVATVPMCPVPVTRSYLIEPNFCPVQLVALIPQFVPDEGPCASCGPPGIPPVYASGQYVLVRQTPEMQERVARFLTDMGAYVPRKRSR